MSDISWIGSFADIGASFPIINRHLADAFDAAGYSVLRNRHNVGDQITPAAVAFEYPPKPLNVAHDFEAVMSIWEFGGGGAAVPNSFKDTFESFALVIVPNHFVAEQYQEATQTPVAVIPYIGVDSQEFSFDGLAVDWSELFPGEEWPQQAEKIIISVGGSDLRHGWDVASQVLDRLPSNVHMVGKLSTNYPLNVYVPKHERFHLLRADFENLAPFYRAADVAMIPARGVGFSMPAIEALACGLPLAATDLDPIRDFADQKTFFAGGAWEPLTHHMHRDCFPLWKVPDVDEMLHATEQALNTPKQQPSAEWLHRWSWEAIAKAFMLELATWL